LALTVAAGRGAGDGVVGAAILLDRGPGEGEVVLEDAAGVDDVAVEVGGRRRGGDREQVRGAIGRGQELGDAAEADTDHADAAIGPRLARDPFDRVVAVGSHRVREGVELALRASGAAHRYADDRVATL